MFNSDSRWDRQLPSQGYEEDMIEVGALFKGGSIIPKAFIWKNRKYQIKEMTYHWQERRGVEVLYYFTVSDGSNLYQIYLNNRYMHWRLEKVCPL